MQYISSTSIQTNWHTLLVRPYPEAFNNFERVLIPPHQEKGSCFSLKSRVKHLAVGALLLVPLINALAMAVLLKFKELESRNEKQKEQLEKQAAAIKTKHDLKKKMNTENQQLKEQLEKQTEEMTDLTEKHNRLKTRHNRLVRRVRENNKKVLAERKEKAPKKVSFDLPEKTTTTKYQRKYPSPSLMDTVIIRNGVRQSVHQLEPFIKDEDILHIHELSEKKTRQSATHKEVEVAYSDGKAVIQQQAVRSCVPTCVAMIALDHGKEPNLDLLFDVNLSNSESEHQWLRKAGLVPKSILVDKTDRLKGYLESGPLLLGVSTNIGGHEIILDALDEKKATIRDPYHGWRIDVKRAAFEDLLEDRIRATVVADPSAARKASTSWFPAILS